MLTPKQRELLEFIHRRLQRDGVPPSFDEMREALGLRSKSGIHRLVTSLEERGFLRRLPHKARALEIIRLPQDLGGDAGAPHPAPAGSDGAAAPEGAMQQLPIMGRIAAGTPIEAIAEELDRIPVPANLAHDPGRHYALEVKGDSMIDAGILDGDIVIIREQSTAENGDIVVALVEGSEATLKRYRRKGDRIALEAANPAYETRILHEDQVRVQGRLVGLIRRY